MSLIDALKMKMEYRIMNWRAKIWIFRHVRLLLLLGFGLLTVSPLSQARTLKIGDEYGGGIVIALFPSDEGGVKKSAEEVMIAGETNMSEHLYWSHLKTASDTFNGALYRDWVEPGVLSSRTVAGTDAVERDAQNSSR
ncbi:MAG: hypothetical protein WCG61_05875 [Chlorobium sp.]